MKLFNIYNIKFLLSRNKILKESNKRNKIIEFILPICIALFVGEY